MGIKMKRGKIIFDRSDSLWCIVIIYNQEKGVATENFIPNKVIECYRTRALARQAILELKQTAPFLSGYPYTVKAVRFRKNLS